MARVLSEGSGKGAEQSAHQTILSSNDSGPIHLPSGVDAANLEMTRDGQDLVLTAPDGQTYIVENYFSGLESPVLISPNGALLSPALVQSFLKTAGDVQVAAADGATDNSPVGEVSEVTGNATVTHADGSKETVTNGTKIFEHDIIETDAHGAVNIKFADESTFAVSQNARMAVDDFSFNAGDQSGTTGISILRGVFMFTSGLIGRENPDAVHLETPVGSIGIRGTIIGGQIEANGHGQISVLEGAIVIHNGTGEQILSNQFETVKLTGFNAPITNIGQLDAAGMTQSYGAVSAVSQSLFTSIQDTARDQQQQQQNGQGQQGQTPAQDTKGADQPQQQQQPAGDQHSSNAQAPAADAVQAQTQAPAQSAPAMDTTPVFQVLNTNSGLGTLGSAPQTAAPNFTPFTTSTPVVVTTQPAAPVTTTQTTTVQEVVVDQRSPSSLAFTNGGSINENEGGRVVGTVAQTNPSGFQVAYSLVNDANGMFIINGAGEISTTRAAGDYDTGLHGYDLTVRATRVDTNQSTDTNLTVAVNNVDEAPSFNLPGFDVNEGATLVLTRYVIGATDPEGAALTYTVSNQHTGTIKVNGVAATTFTQAQLDAGLVTYVHDGSEPNVSGLFTLTATDPANNASEPRTIPVHIHGVNDAPVLANNAGGSVAEGAYKLITPALLNWSDSDNAPSSVTFTLTGVTNGTVHKYVSGVLTQLTNGGTFTEQDIADGKVKFIHNGSETTTGSFSYTVTDGLSAPQSNTLNFTITPVNDAPVAASMTGAAVDEGGAVVLSQANLHYTDVDTAAGNLRYTPTSITNGVIQTSTDGTNWTNLNAGGYFTQADVDSGRVRFQHNGSETTTASFNYTLNDGTTTLTSQMNVTVTPVNDVASAFALNDGHAFIPGNYDALVQGHQKGAIIGRLSATDADNASTHPEWTPQAANYRITAVSGAGGLTTDSFEVIDVVRLDGTVEQVLRLKSDVSANFTLNSTANIQVTIALDADMDGDFTTGANTLVHTYQFAGRNDTMVLDTVFSDPAHAGNNNGFHILNSSRFGGQFASGMAVADVNGDGKLDMVFGAPNATGNDSETGGGVYVFSSTNLLGNAASGELDLSHVTEIAGYGFFRENATGTNDTGDAYGKKVVALRHFDGDTAAHSLSADIAVVLPGNTAGSTGRVEIIRNGDTNTLTTITNIPVVGTGDALANSITIASGGDINRDGYTDLIIGVRGATNGTTYDGEIAIVYGSANPLATVDYATLERQFISGVGNGYGSTVAGVGDFNGDGYADVLVGTPLTDRNSGTVPDAGTAQLYYGSSTGLHNTNYFTMKGIGTNDLLGSHISAAGDFNGDGLSDFMVGESATSSGHGSVTVVLGRTATLTSSLDLNQITNTVTFNLSGSDSTAHVVNFSNAGDFNGDGYDDVAIDVSKAHGDGSYDHTVFVVYGSALPLSSYDLTALDSSESLAFKIKTNSASKELTLSSASDMNGDGYDDLLIGDPLVDNGNGQATLVYGANYNAANTAVGGTVENGKAYMGTMGNDNLDARGHDHITFYGGSGDDVMAIDRSDAVSTFRGGFGKDTLKLFFSEGETPGSATADTINLTGIKMTSIEKIEFAAGSMKDTLQLSIADVIQMAQRSDDIANGLHRLWIVQNGSTGLGEENHLNITNNGTSITSLATLTGALHFDRNASHDSTTGGVTYSAYTNTNSGVEVLVDNRIAEAGLLAAG